MPKVLDMGIGKKGEVWWKTTLPANRKLWIPQHVIQVGEIKDGEEIKITIEKGKDK